MTAEIPCPAPVRTAAPSLVLELVVPVYNEQHSLPRCLDRLHPYLCREFPYSFRITIVDNASTDDTLAVAERLARRYPDVTVVHLAEKGRGRALRAAWAASTAEIVAYADVDLSTDLAAVLPLVAPLRSGHSELAIGTRLARGARVVRGSKREVISRGYNLLLRHLLGVGFSDAQCGFKAVRRDVAHRLLPHVRDGDWFFDTELLVVAERAGLRIHEVPVDWVDDPDSRVDVRATAWADLRGIARLRRTLRPGRTDWLAGLTTRPPAPYQSTLVPQLLRFAAVGAVSTLAYLALYLLLRAPLGAQPANLTALLLTAVGNTAANRRLTFGVVGRAGAWGQQLQGLVAFGVGWTLSAAALAGWHRTAAGSAGRWGELAVLVGANAAATVVRFVLLRRWVFAAGRGRRGQRSSPVRSP